MMARRLLPIRGAGTRLALLGLAALLLLDAVVVPSVRPTQAAFSGTTTNAGNSLTAKRIFPGTRTRSVWDVLDTSGGTQENRSALTAYVDGLLRSATGLPTAYSTRYLDFQYGGTSSLPAGVPFTSPTFNFDFSASRSGDTVCYYIEVRRTSTGELLATHGGPGNDAGCVTGTTITATSVSIPSVSTTTIANDLTIRVFPRNTAGQAIRIDRATVSGSAYSNYTLFDRVFADSSDVNPVRWALAEQDSAFLQSFGEWSSSYSTSRYLEFRFPRLVPTGAAVTSVQLNHRYRSSGSSSVCYYLEIYEAGTLIGSHGGPGSDLSCASSTYLTVNRVLSEVNTVSRANNLTVRLYGRSASNPTVSMVQDTVTVDVNYTLD